MSDPRLEPTAERIAYLEGRLQTCQEQLAATPITNEPLLGLASTETLFRELIARFTNNMYGEHTKMLDFERALVLAEMLGGLGSNEREYRTVGHG